MMIAPYEAQPAPAAEQTMQGYIPSPHFAGTRAGYVFKLGYYREGASVVKVPCRM